MNNINDANLLSTEMAAATTEPQPLRIRNRTRRIDSQLLAAQQGLTNARTDPALWALLNQAAFDEVQLVRGEAIYQRALALHKQVQSNYGQQYAATDRFQQAWATAKEAYAYHLKFARLVFDGNREAVNSLMLRGKRHNAFAGWLDQARHFYDHLLANPAYVATMTRLSIPRQELASAQALVEAAAAARYERDRLQGEAQHTTRLRHAALADLTRWMRYFRAIARAVLISKPRYLRKLGISVPASALRPVEDIDEESVAEEAVDEEGHSENDPPVLSVLDIQIL